MKETDRERKRERETERETATWEVDRDLRIGTHRERER